MKRTAARKRLASPRKPASGRLALELQAQRLLREVIAAVRSHQREIETMTDVPAPHLRLLLLLRERPGLTVGAYAEWLGLHMSTVSNLIRDLHRSGFIERASDPQDRRRTLLKLTAAGEQKSRARVDFIRGLLPALLERLSPTDLRALIRVMSRLLDQAPRRFRRVETPGRS